jgi:hypothetical protein
MLRFCHNDIYFGRLLLLLCSFCACWLRYLCSCWYFSFGFLLLNVNFMILHISYVVVLLLVFHVGYCCCFCHVNLLALPLFSHYVWVKEKMHLSIKEYG